MTYYAVTNDPNELMHFGILGMKWGRRRTPEQLGHPRHHGNGRRASKPRSEAYKKAQSKLGKMMKSGIKKAEAHWKEYNSPKAKEERFMKKAMQQARTGTLKYGKLTDDQVRRVTDRLALERNARQLGSTENPRYAKRLKMAIGEGIVRGVGAGAGAYIEERFRGRGRTDADIKRDKRMAKYEGREDVQRRRAQNKLTEEYYKTAYEEGDNPAFIMRNGNRARANDLSEVKARNKASEVRAANQTTYDDQYYRARATNDAKAREDWARGLRSDSGKAARKLGGGSELQKLRDWNAAHEARNYAADDYLRSLEGAAGRNQVVRWDGRSASGTIYRVKKPKKTTRRPGVR